MSIPGQFQADSRLIPGSFQVNSFIIQVLLHYYIENQLTQTITNNINFINTPTNFYIIKKKKEKKLGGYTSLTLHTTQMGARFRRRRPPCRVFRRYITYI